MIGVALTQIIPLFNLDSFWSAAIGASRILGILVGAIFRWLFNRPDWASENVHYRYDCHWRCFDSFDVFNRTTSFSFRAASLSAFCSYDYPISTAMITEFTSKKYRAIAMGVVTARGILAQLLQLFLVLPYSLLQMVGNGC